MSEKKKSWKHFQSNPCKIFNYQSMKLRHPETKFVFFLPGFCQGLLPDFLWISIRFIFLGIFEIPHRIHALITPGFIHFYQVSFRDSSQDTFVFLRILLEILYGLLWFVSHGIFLPGYVLRFRQAFLPGCLHWFLLVSGLLGLSYWFFPKLLHQVFLHWFLPGSLIQGFIQRFLYWSLQLFHSEYFNCFLSEFLKSILPGFFLR